MATRVSAVWSKTTAGAKPSGRSPKPSTARVPAARSRVTSGSREVLGAGRQRDRLHAGEGVLEAGDLVGGRVDERGVPELAQPLGDGGDGTG